MRLADGRALTAPSRRAYGFRTEDSPSLRVVPVAFPLIVYGALISASCQVVGGYDVFERSEPVEPIGQLGECSVIDSPKPAKANTNLVLIDDPDASCFWMDATEVTVREYRLWIGTLEGISPNWGTSEFCKQWKEAGEKPFDPDQPDGCVIPTPPPSGRDLFDDDLPIRCVDWCEADAYCRWADKRLCKVATRTSNDEWQIACSAGYTQTYPFDPSAGGKPCTYEQSCASGCGPLPAGQDEDCSPARGYPLDLGGNVDEWIDESIVSTGWCGARGGSYLSRQEHLKCSNTSGGFVTNRDARIGFRCCADLTSEEKARLPE